MLRIPKVGRKKQAAPQTEATTNSKGSSSNKPDTQTTNSSSASVARNSKQPADTPFKQQRLPAWQPILSPPWLISCMMLLAGVFIPVGVLVITASTQLRQVVHRYDGEQEASSRLTKEDLEAVGLSWLTTNNSAQKTYLEYRAFTISIPSRMDPPIYMYYKLTNFHQNHRRFSKSKNDAQLSGKQITKLADLSHCAPLAYAGEIPFEDKPSDKQTKADKMRYQKAKEQAEAVGMPNAYAPCGLIAYMMFNDTFDLFLGRPNSSSDLVCEKARSTLQTTEDCPAICRTRLDAVSEQEWGNRCLKAGVAWASDQQVRYKAPYITDAATRPRSRMDPDFSRRYYHNEGPVPGVREGHLIPNQTDEDFMVWSRTAALSTFRKLYRIIDVGFDEGDKLVVIVHDRYPVGLFGGRKFIVLSTTTWIGTQNFFVGIAYVSVGSACFVLALVFLIKQLTGTGSYVPPQRRGSLT